MLPGHAEYATVLERFAAPGASRHVAPVVDHSGPRPNTAGSRCCPRSPVFWRRCGCRRSTQRVCCCSHGGLRRCGKPARVGAVRRRASLPFSTRATPGAPRRDGDLHQQGPPRRDARDDAAGDRGSVAVQLAALGFAPSQRPIATLASEAAAKRLLLFACAVSILVCLVFTRSRAGIALGLVALVASAIVLERARAASPGDETLHKTRAAGLIVTALVALAAILALVIGAEPVIGGFEPGSVAGERRRPDRVLYRHFPCGDRFSAVRQRALDIRLRVPALPDRRSRASPSTTRTTITCRRSWSWASWRR